MNIILSLLGSGLFSAAASNPTYLDPGSGSFIIQMLIAGAAGMLFAMRGYWSKLLGFLKKSPPEDTEESEEDEE